MKLIYRIAILSAATCVLSIIFFLGVLYYCISEYLKTPMPLLLEALLTASFIFTVLSLIVTVGFGVSSGLEFIFSKRCENAEQGAAANP